MTGYLTYDANVARVDDLHRRAQRRRIARDTARTRTPGAGVAEAVTIRRATEADGAALERLAALDSASALTGEVLLAEVGDGAVGAIEVSSGVAIADPFRPTAEVVEVLRVRAGRVHRGTSRRRLPLRPAYGAV
jgi:hypothetical protein